MWKAPQEAFYLWKDLGYKQDLGQQEEGGVCQAKGTAHGDIPRIKGCPLKDIAE